MCGVVFERSGGNRHHLENTEALVRASWRGTVGDDEQPLEPFVELSEHLRAAATRLHVDGHFVRAMNGVSSEYRGVDFPAVPALAIKTRWSLAAIPQRVKAWVSNSSFLGLLHTVMILFFFVATIAEGSKYAQWAKANAASRALFAEDRTYACVSAPHISFFAYMVRDLLGIPRLD